MTIWLEAILFGIFTAPIVLISAIGIRKVVIYELNKMSPDEIIALHRHQYGRRKHDKRLKELE